MGQTAPSDESPLPNRADGWRRLTPDDVKNIVAKRAIVEQAKGILMFVYDTDADTAFEMIRRRSRITHVKLVLLAAQLVNDVVALTPDERLNLQQACDNLLLTLHERVL